MSISNPQTNATSSSSSNLPEQLRLEALDPSLELKHIQELATQLLLNESPNPQQVAVTWLHCVVMSCTRRKVTNDGRKPLNKP